MAMRLNHVNRPEGRGYAETLHQLYVDAGSIAAVRANEPDEVRRDRNKTMTTMTAVLWLNEDAQRITILREILADMTPGERSRLNSPITARQRVEKEIKRREAEARKQKGEAEAEATSSKESKLAKLERRNAELERDCGGA